MSILAGLLGSLGKKEVAGTLTKGVQGLFGSNAASSGIVQGTIGALSTAALPAAGISAGLGIAGNVMNANTMSDMTSLGRENGFRTNEFLTRNTDILNSLRKDSGIDAQMLKNAQQGGLRGFGANIKLRNAYEEMANRYNDIAPYLGAAEGNEIGNRIANSTPEYQSPAYGRKGMKFRPRSKFSYQTKKI